MDSTGDWVFTIRVKDHNHAPSNNAALIPAKKRLAWRVPDGQRLTENLSKVSKLSSLNLGEQMMLNNPGLQDDVRNDRRQKRREEMTGRTNFQHFLYQLRQDRERGGRSIREGRRHRQSPWGGVARGVCGGDVPRAHDEGRDGGQIQGDGGVDHGHVRPETTLPTPSWARPQTPPVEESAKDPRRALLPAAVGPRGDGYPPFPLRPDGHARVLVVRQRRATVPAPPVYEVPGMATADEEAMEGCRGGL
jgi:hypothetical protein